MESFDQQPQKVNAQESTKVLFEHSSESYKEIIFWSFLLSQGNPQIQKVVLDYVVQQVGAFDQEGYERALELFVEQYFDENELELSDKLRQFHKPIEGKPKTVERQYDWHRTYDTSTPLKTLKYQMGFLDRQPTQEVKDVNLKIFANLLWKTDAKYIAKSKYGTEAKGRPNRVNNGEGSGKLKDKWFSFGVYYLIQKNGVPNVPVIDQLLTVARKISPLQEYSSDKLKRLRLSELNDIIEAYNLKHPHNMTTMNEITEYFSNIQKDIDINSNVE